MALNKELLDKDPQLQGLSDEVKNAIITLSANNEQTEFDSKFAALHNELDTAIKEVSGIGKNTNEKTSTYLKRVLGEQKTSIESVTAERDTLTSKVTTLEEQIAKGGGNEDLIRQKDATIADMQTQYNTLKQEKDAMEADHQATLLNMRIDSELNAALGSISFKSDQNPDAVNVLKAQALQALKTERTPSYITDNSGNEILVFHNADGSEARNQSNGMSLYTAKELLTESLAKYGIVDDGKQAGGTGSKGSTPKPKTNVTSAKTRTEFMAIAESSAAAKGLVRGSSEYDDELVRVMEENKAMYDALPMN